MSWSHRFLATIALALVACAAPPSKLAPATVRGVQSTVVRSYIPEKELQIRKDSGISTFLTLVPVLIPWAPPPGAMVVVPSPVGIVDAVQSAARDRRVAVLRAATSDVDFPRQYWGALEETLTEVDWLKVDGLQRSSWPRRQQVLSQDVAGHGLLVTETRFSLSGDSTVLQVDTALFFYPQDHAGDPAATTQLSYHSERVGPDRDDAAIAAWSANGCSRYRKSIEEGIASNMSLIRVALAFMAGREVPDPRSRVPYYLDASSPSGFGSMVYDDPDRVILRTDDGDFLSLPRGALKPQPEEQPASESRPPP